ncbi:peptidylprolyl isomerase [Pseudomonadota bacterium]
MKKYFFPAIALFIGIASVFLFLELSRTYTTLNDSEAVATQETAILTDPTNMGRIVNVRMETTMGEVMLELYPDKAPETVKNFLSYTNTGAYDGTIFHRVIKGFMNQGGGYTTDYVKKKTQRPISNEAYNGLKNLRGTIAMARTNAPHSATSQFFINTADNYMLNHTEKSLGGWGYAVFGKVVSGMDVMDDIANEKTGSAGPFSQDAPQQQIIILKMSEVQSESDAVESMPLTAE